MSHHARRGLAPAGLLTTAALVAAGFAGAPALASEHHDAPIRSITSEGMHSNLRSPWGVGRDRAGNIYVANEEGDSITVYRSTATGDAAPVRTISGPSTGLNLPNGLSLDTAGRVYVTNLGGNSVTVYAANANGNARPLRTIAGAATTLSNPRDVAVAPNGAVYVTNPDTHTVVSFSATANGNASPAGTITGPRTLLDEPWGVGIDRHGEIVVSNSDDWPRAGVLFYRPGARGDVAPVRSIAGTRTQLESMPALAFDSADNLYVADTGGARIFAPSARGNVAPLQSLRRQTNSSDTCDYASGIALDAARNITLVCDNEIGRWYSVSTYRALIPVPRPTYRPGRAHALRVHGRKGAKRRTITWRRPAYNGGAHITRYRVLIRKGHRRLLVRTVSSANRRIVVPHSRLRGGRDLVFVRALNAKGYGPWTHIGFRVRK